ncbi:MAG TPA: M48 family metallopeptidase [Chroococcales cyanobacterium]
MTTAEPKTRRRFPRLTSSAFEHPADRAALEAVKNIPVLDKVVHKMLELGWERYIRIQLLGSAVHVTPKQCRKVYKLFKEAADILDMHEPDLFLMSQPQVNAFTFGVERPFIVIQSGLVDLMDEDELMGVLGHELGHVKAGHVLYRSVAHILAHFVGRFLGGLGTLGLQMALLDWSKKSELTADRAELLVTQDIETCLRINMKLAGGSKTVYEQIDHNEFLKQAESYEELEYNTLNKLYKMFQELMLTHPVPVYRAKEIKSWSEGKQFKEIMAGRYPTDDAGPGLKTCPHCSSKISPSFFFCPDCGKNARI